MILTRAVGLLLGVGLAGGCAVKTGAPAAVPVVNSGGPAIDEVARALAEGALPPEQRAAARPPSARSVIKESAGARVESIDPRLAATLRLLAASPSAANNLSVAREYVRVGILDTAFTYADRAMAQEPRLAEAHEMLARIWRDWGLPGMGIGSASRATFFDRTSASAQNTLGTLLDAVGQPDVARQAFGRAVALDAKAAWALNNLCFAELRVDLVVEARSHCEAALRLDPQLIAAHNNLALTFVASGDAAAARLAFLAAGDPAAAAYNRGIVHLTRREYGRAVDAFGEAIAERPMFSAAKARAHEARMLTLTDARD